MVVWKTVDLSVQDVHEGGDVAECFKAKKNNMKEP